MAEVFGIVTGALSVAALFNNCVDTFEYIQLGRNFGEDYGRCQLKLDVAKTRLGRWGQAVGINNDERFASASPKDNAVKNAREILEDIVDCFETAQKKSKRYEKSAEDTQELVVYDEKDMNTIFRRLHTRSKDIARQRQKGTSLAKKFTWALYDGKSLEKTINQISSWVDDLEKLFPVEAVCRELVMFEIEEVDDEPSLTTLKDVAHKIDPVLEDAVERKVAVIEGKNFAKEVNLDELSRFRLGNEYSDAALQREIRINDKTNNSVETVSAKNKSRVHIGNSYGGKGILDD